MLINVRQLKTEKHISFDGSEEWLSEVFTLLDLEPSPLTGHVTIEPLNYDQQSYVELELHYKPSLVCGSCLESFAFPIDYKATLEFRDSEDPLQNQKDITLNSQDIEINYLEKGNLDLFQLINEIIQLAIPTYPVHTEIDHPCTLRRQDDDQDTVIYSDATSESESPFAILKKLKN